MITTLQFRQLYRKCILVNFQRRKIFEVITLEFHENKDTKQQKKEHTAVCTFHSYWVCHSVALLHARNMTIIQSKHNFTLQKLMVTWSWIIHSSPKSNKVNGNKHRLSNSQIILLIRDLVKHVKIIIKLTISKACKMKICINQGEKYLAIVLLHCTTFKYCPCWTNSKLWLHPTTSKSRTANWLGIPGIPMMCKHRRAIGPATVLRVQNVDQPPL